MLMLVMPLAAVVPFQYLILYLTEVPAIVGLRLLVRSVPYWPELAKRLGAQV